MMMGAGRVQAGCSEGVTCAEEGRLAAMFVQRRSDRQS